jgi:superkiller protein 3
MTPTRHVTAVLLLAAFAASGCSDRGDTSQSDKPSPQPVQTMPVTTPADSPAATDSRQQAVGNAPKITGTFADGEAAYRAKRYNDAIAIFDSYVARRPDNASGHYMLALSAWKAGDSATAEQAFERALSVDPRHVKSLMNLSRVLIEGKRYDDAIERLTRAAEIDPESAEVYRLLGRAYGSRGTVDEAVDAYHRAIELNARDAWSMNNLGLLFLETKRAHEALPLLAKAVELRNDVPEFHNNFGIALERTGQFRAAAAAYGGALKADPRYARAKQNLARVERVSGGPAEPLEVDRAANAIGEDVHIPSDTNAASK